MSISNNNNFDPRFDQQVGGFDDAPDVIRSAARDRSAAGATAELARLRQEDSQALIAQQAFANLRPDKQSSALTVEQAEIPIFDELGDHLSTESSLSTGAKIELMKAMLDEMRHREDARTAYDASRRSVTTHAANASGGVRIQLPVGSKFKKFGPKRKGNETNTN